MYVYDGAGNEQIVNAPIGITTNTWGIGNQLIEISLAERALNTTN